MSSQSSDWGAEAHAREAQDTDASPATHPRGAGFRILSRMARRGATDDDGYAPRHRLAAPEPDDG